MAVELEEGTVPGLVAGASLVSSQFLAVDESTAAPNTVVAHTVAGAPILGVLKNNPAQGFPAVVQSRGRTKMVAGGTIAQGAPVMASATGSAVTAATTGSVQIGVALEPAVVGQIIAVQLNPNAGIHA